jgi:hypothetical protein
MEYLTPQEEFDRAVTDFANIRYPDDCARIIRVGRTMGIVMSTQQAQDLWELHSERMAAGWLMIRDDDEIENAINQFVKRHNSHG